MQVHIRSECHLYVCVHGAPYRRLSIFCHYKVTPDSVVFRLLKKLHMPSNHKANVCVCVCHVSDAALFM